MKQKVKFPLTKRDKSDNMNRLSKRRWIAEHIEQLFCV